MQLNGTMSSVPGSGECIAIGQDTGSLLLPTGP